jgi:hypothetical protein
LHGFKSPLSVVSRQSSVISYQLSVVNRQLQKRLGKALATRKQPALGHRPSLLLQTNLTHWQLAMFVAFEPRISYTARLQDNCNPAMLRTGNMRNPVTPRVFWAYIATNDWQLMTGN